MTSLQTSGPNSQQAPLKLQEPTFKAVLALATASEQKQGAVALIKAATLPVAIAQGQQLAKLLEDEATVAVAKNQLAEMINDVFRFFGQTEAEYAPMKSEIGGSIVAQFANLNIEEIALAFQYGKAGKYGEKGKPFGKLNGSHILTWLTLYLESEEKAGFWERNSKELQKPKEPDNILQILSQAGAFGTDVNGRLQIKAPALPAAKAPAYGSAEWHRQQAALIEQQEAKQVADKRNALLGQVEAERLQQQTQTDFQQYAQAEFYSKLTAQEKQVLEAANSRMLNPAELQINSALNLRWAKLLIAWEEKLSDAIIDAGERHI